MKILIFASMRFYEKLLPLAQKLRAVGATELDKDLSKLKEEK